MPRFGERLLTCPGCRKRGVSLRMDRGPDDVYCCRYCEWSAYASGSDDIDVIERAKLENLTEQLR